MWILCGSVVCSLFAKFFWFFDLFSHFLMQYFIGGILLSAFLLGFRKYKLSFLALCIALISFTESRINLEKPFQFFAPLNTASVIEEKPIRLVQYNHNIGKRNFNDVKQWLEQNSDKFDIVVLQEASSQTVILAESLKHLYPYQIHEPRDHPFGMVILSHHQISEQEIIPLHGPNFNNILIRLAIDFPNSEEPIIVYALHAVPPIGSHYFTQRNFELHETARIISEDDAQNLVLIGDWNLTPYSPYFADLLQTSGLKFQSSGLFLNPTWPSFIEYNFLKIPIDHVLQSSSLKFLDKNVFQGFHSDHNILITTLGVSAE
jgi:endonuclease/exonuclease/phosphatase (EEP) superfamily protein YafD